MAAHLGMSVRRAQAEIDSAEFSEWAAFDKIHPIGGVRDDINAGIVAATIANCHRGKGQRAFSAGDFIPDYGDDLRQSPEDMASIFKAFAIAHNKRAEKGA